MSGPRADARKRLASLLGAALVGAGKPAQAVYDHQTGDFGGQAPVVVVSSGPISREHDSMGDCWRTRFQLLVYVFVPYADPASNWTEADAEDAIDAIEDGIAGVILANGRSEAWTSIAYGEGSSQLDAVVIGGVEYRRELTVFDVQVF